MLMSAPDHDAFPFQRLQNPRNRSAEMKKVPFNAPSASMQIGGSQRQRKLASVESPSAALSQHTGLQVAVEYEAADVLLGLAVGSQDGASEERRTKRETSGNGESLPLQAIPVALPASLEEASAEVNRDDLPILLAATAKINNDNSNGFNAKREHGRTNKHVTFSQSYAPPNNHFRTTSNDTDSQMRNMSGQRIGALRVPISQPQMKLQLLIQKQNEQQRLIQQRQAQQQREAAYQQAQQVQHLQQQQAMAREREMERERMALLSRKQEQSRAFHLMASAVSPQAQSSALNSAPSSSNAALNNNGQSSPPQQPSFVNMTYGATNVEPALQANGTVVNYPRCMTHVAIAHYIILSNQYARSQLAPNQQPLQPPSVQHIPQIPQLLTAGLPTNNAPRQKKHQKLVENNPTPPYNPLLAKQGLNTPSQSIASQDSQASTAGASQHDSVVSQLSQAVEEKKRGKEENTTSSSSTASFEPHSKEVDAGDLEEESGEDSEDDAIEVEISVEELSEDEVEISVEEISSDSELSEDDEPVVPVKRPVGRPRKAVPNVNAKGRGRKQSTTAPQKKTKGKKTLEPVTTNRKRRVSRKDTPVVDIKKKRRVSS